MTNFHHGMDASIFQYINNNLDEKDNEDIISNSTNNFTHTIENINIEDSEDDDNEDKEDVSKENDSFVEFF